MTIRFRKKINLFRGFSINLGKQSISASVGIKGLHVTKGLFGTQKTTTSVGLPGTGISHVGQSTPSKQSNSSISKIAGIFVLLIASLFLIAMCSV